MMEARVQVKFIFKLENFAYSSRTNTWIHDKGSFELGNKDEPMQNKATIYIETLTMPDGSKLGCSFNVERQMDCPSL